MEKYNIQKVQIHEPGYLRIDFLCDESVDLAQALLGTLSCVDRVNSNTDTNFRRYLIVYPSPCCSLDEAAAGIARAFDTHM